MRLIAAIVVLCSTVASFGADEKVVAMEASSIREHMREMKPTGGTFVLTSSTKEKEGAKGPKLMDYAVLERKKLDENAKESALALLLDSTTYGARPMGAFEPEWGMHFISPTEAVIVLVSLKGNCITWRIRGKETTLPISKAGHAALTAFHKENTKKTR